MQYTVYNRLMKQPLSFVLYCIGGIALAAALFFGIRNFLSNQGSEALLDSMRQTQESEADVQDVIPAISAMPLETAIPTAEPTAAPTQIPLVENPYAESFLANEDMAAWIVIDGTVVDYPVMWTPRDEEYYLRRGFDGSYSSAGCLILDTDSCLAPLTTNLIIHGHNMRNGSMFAVLADYEDEDFYQEHQTITLYTADVERRYEVMAVFRSQVYKKTDEVFKFYQFFQADTEEEFADFYDNVMALAEYDTGVTAEFGDHFLTLSTCAYHVTNGRLVVVAKEVEEGDHYLPMDE